MIGLRTKPMNNLLFMKTFLTIIFLIFSFQSLTKANDISDFELEGFSIGDSLLDFFSKKEILNNSIADYKNNKFIRFIPNLSSLNLTNYDTVNFHYKNNDEFIIYEISGGIIYNNKHEKCKIKMNEVVSKIESELTGYKKMDKGTVPFLDIDSSGKSITTRVTFEKKNSGMFEVACYDFSKKIENEYKWSDSLRISVNNSVFQKWLNTEAY